MNTFLEFAISILEKSQKPLHYKDITHQAIENGLESNGETPWATMNAQYTNPRILDKKSGTIKR